jgi:tetratricopeptide (TPR) repeat protein
MKTKILFMILFLAGNVCLVSGQEDSWFRKGLEATEPEDKVVYLTESIWLEGETAEKYALRAEAYVNLGWEEKAIDGYSRAISMNPGIIEWHLKRVELFVRKGDADNVIRDYSAILSLDSTRGCLYVFRGLYYFATGKKEQACNDFYRAMERDPLMMASAMNQRITEYGTGFGITVDSDSVVAYCPVLKQLKKQ